MPSLRELLGRICGWPGHYNRDVYALLEKIVKELEALVEAVEPEDMPTDAEYNDARDDRIRLLQNELADAKAETKRLRVGFLDTIREVQQQRDKAKAEIERLRDDLSALHKCYRQVLNDRHEAEAKAEKLEADAALGRLVRGMRRGTRLMRGSVGMYCSYRFTGGDIESAEAWVGAIGCAVGDPAEALRSIQEKGDDEATGA